MVSGKERRKRKAPGSACSTAGTTDGEEEENGMVESEKDDDEEEEKKAEALRVNRDKQKKELQQSLRDVRTQIETYQKKTLEKALQEVRTMALTVVDKTQELSDLLEKSKDVIKTDIDETVEKEGQASLQGLKDAYRRIIKMVALSEYKKEAVNETLQELNAWNIDLEDDVPDVEANLLQRIQEKQNNWNDELIDKHAEMAKWKEETQEMEEIRDGDNVISVVKGNKIPEKCPLLLTAMEDPMQSKKCGHIISKKGVLSFFKENQPKNCPMQGCNKQLHKSDFSTSEQLTELWQREKKKRDRQKHLAQKTLSSQQID